MQELSRISPTDLNLAETSAPLCSEALTLASASTPPLNAESLKSVGQLMALTQARYPNQELPPGAETMFLAEWEEMVFRYGLTEFREALARVIRDRDRAPFFPAPEEIEQRIREKRRSESERQKTLDVMSKLDAAKAAWMLERAEDIANGIERAPLNSALSSAMVRRLPKPAAGRHTPEEIAAYVDAHVTPEQRNEMRERMRTLTARAEDRALEHAST